jgi:hypothetical protein
MISFDNREKIKNILIFISDALRYDYTPENISRMGIKTKMIASSTFTAPTFPSIISGLYPFNHKVYSFHGSAIDQKVPTLMNLKGYYKSLWTENSWLGLNERSPLHRVIRCNRRVSLENIKEPFIYIEDEKGGHCPYGWPIINSQYEEWDCQSFFKDYSKKETSELIQSYKKGLERTESVFKKRIETLIDRGIEDNTLVIFTSDHGELLGEYGGLVGHTLVSVPELIYVPLIFIHPELPKNVNLKENGILRQVDVFPTILDILNIKINKDTLDGKSIYENPILPKQGFSYFNEKPKMKGLQKYLSYELKELGLWKENSGIVIRKNISFLKRFSRSLMLTKFKKDEINVIYRKGMLQRKGIVEKTKEDIEAIKLLSSKSLKFGDDIDLGETYEILNKISI